MATCDAISASRPSPARYGRSRAPVDELDRRVPAALGLGADGAEQRRGGAVGESDQPSPPSPPSPCMISMPLRVGRVGDDQVHLAGIGGHRIERDGALIDGVGGDLPERGLERGGIGRG